MQTVAFRWKRDFCGQRFKDDTGKLFKDDGGEDFENSGGENSDGEGERTSKSGGENSHSGKGFGNAGGVFVLGFGGGLDDQDAGDRHTEVNIVSQALKARVAGFASKHGLDQAASAKPPGHDGQCGTGCGGARRQRQGAQPKRIRIQDGHSEGARGNVLLGQRGAVGLRTRWVASRRLREGEHGDQFAGELVNMRTARAGIGQRSAAMISPSDGAWTRRGATMVGRPTATTRGITTAITMTMRKATAMTTKSLGIEGEPSVGHQKRHRAPGCGFRGGGSFTALPS